MRLKLSLLDVCVLMIIVGIIGVLAGLLTSGGDFDLNHRFPPKVDRPGVDLSNIAGEYYQGDGLSLSILADGRYSFIWSGCTGVADRESGYVRNGDGSYMLSPLKRDESEKSSSEGEYILVRWQSRRYLVPRVRMEEFCDAILKGDEPRSEQRGGFYLAIPFGEAEGFPEQPERLASFLRDHAVTGKITEVRERSVVSVDLGKKHGLRKGSILTVRGRHRFDYRRLEVVSVEAGSCTARGYYSGRDDNDQSLKPGQEVIAEKVNEPINGS